MYLTDEKVAVMGAAGAIGSNIVQDLLSTKTACRIAMYDPFAQGLEGAAEEIYHCAYPGAEVTWTADVKEALSGASFVISSGGAPRKEGMTREDLLKGNCEIARGLGEDIKRYTPNAKFVVVIFNPADITGLTALVYSGLAPGRVSTLAALDSTRLQTKLAQHFSVPQERVTGCRTYGGHGEQMAVFEDGIVVDGVPFAEIMTGKQVNEKSLSVEEWQEVQAHIRQGGARIIKLRGRSSYQSPSHQSVEMLAAFIRGGGYPWPCGAYIPDGEFGHVMMAADVEFTPEGLKPAIPKGSDKDLEALKVSYGHIVKLRDEVIAAGSLPPVSEWPGFNVHLK